jgi:hypothetical protein
MPDVPASLQPAVRRLQRRLALGLFLDVWPPWAAAALLAAGCIALACRILVPDASPYLLWLWAAPLAAAVPALAICVARAYRAGDVVALADWLSGGQGVLLTLFERDEPAWIDQPLVRRAATVPLPRLRPWRRLSLLVPAAAFFAVALLLPQRVPALSHARIADEIAADLAAMVQDLKQQELITPAEEKALEEEIERVRKDALARMDASSWESADALREKVAASLESRDDAAAWAQDSLERFAAAADGKPSARSAAQAAELRAAIEKLAQSGLLENTPAGLRQLLDGDSLPTDAEGLGQLAAALAEYLGQTRGRIRAAARRAGEARRFDPSEFELDEGEGEAVAGSIPGQGGVTRGRADAELTWGKETLPTDRFKAQALPPGAVRSADDWAPVALLPGAPETSPERSGRAVARAYADESGQAAWRRTLAPRHHSAVRKYFSHEPR